MLEHLFFTPVGHIFPLLTSNLRVHNIRVALLLSQQKGTISISV